MNQCVLQFVSPAADVLLTRFQFHAVTVTNHLTALARNLAIEPDLARHDRALRLLPAFTKTLLNQYLIQPPHGSTPSWVVHLLASLICGVPSNSSTTTLAI